MLFKNGKTHVLPAHLPTGAVYRIKLVKSLHTGSRKKISISFLMLSPKPAMTRNLLTEKRSGRLTLNISLFVVQSCEKMSNISFSTTSKLSNITGIVALQRWAVVTMINTLSLFRWENLLSLSLAQLEHATFITTMTLTAIPNLPFGLEDSEYHMSELPLLVICYTSGDTLQFRKILLASRFCLVVRR